MKRLTCPLSVLLLDLMFPFPIRSISWHPTQHLLAIAMVGHGAAVAVYTGDKENIEKTFERTTTTAATAGARESGPINADNKPPSAFIDSDPVVAAKSKITVSDEKKPSDLSVLIKSEKTR